MVLFPCSDCCQCGCPYTHDECVRVTLSGFSGTGGCSECNHINGDYVLRRVVASNEPIPHPGIGARHVETVAFVSVTTAKNEDTGEYFISSVTLETPGGGYSPDAKFGVWLDDAVLNPCPKKNQQCRS